MIEYLKHLTTIIFDSSKSWGVRSSRLIAIIFLLILTDLIFNISYNIFTENKLIQLEKIAVLKKEYSKNPKKLSEINLIEEDVFTKEHYSEFISRNFKNFRVNQNKVDFEVSSNDKILVQNTNIVKVSMFWMILSSNTFLIFALILVFFLIIFGGKENRQSSYIVGLIASTFIILIFIFTITLIAYQIPIINEKKLYYNYILNFLIQILFLLFFGKIISKNEKKIIV